MIDTQRTLERELERLRPPRIAFEQLERRLERKRRDQRVAAGILGIAVFALAAIGLIRLLGSERTPAADPRNAFEGAWVSATDDDGGTHRMMIRLASDGAVDIAVTDEFSPECSGERSNMTGTGRIEDPTTLVIPSPVFTCGYRIEPVAPSGPPLQEQLRDWTLTFDPPLDSLSDSLGGRWRRDVGAAMEPLWPQTSMDEVRRAQDLADAGDPEATWQLDTALGVQLGQNHPVDAEIFTRFLGEELGWEAFLWDEAFAHPDGLGDGEVVYVRCAPDRSNSLYPNAPDGCAPTIDDLRYETVRIGAAQLAREGPSGIWVVTGWEIVDPVAQADPRVIEAEATALLEDFLGARIDGEGAEGFVELGHDPFAEQRVDREIPLLYATSTGASFERSEFGFVEGPEWPSGRMRAEVRLFAENDETVVEQTFSIARDGTGRLRVVYDPVLDAAGRPDPATTENGDAVPGEYGFLDGRVTYRATFPVGPHQDLWEQGPDVATVVGSGERRLLVLVADPRPLGPGCEETPAPADAAALAQRLRSDRDFEVGAPVPVTIGGISAVQLDVVLAPDPASCSWELPNLSSSTPVLFDRAPFAEADRARVYLLDLPGGPSRVLAIAVMADEDSFERTLALIAPIVDSIEFHAP